MTVSEQKKIQKRNALLNSAYELFTTIGFHKTTIGAIARKAGVAKGTFYLYFKDKEEIRNALIVHKSSHLLHAALNALDRELDQRSTPMPPEDKLVFIADYLITFLSQDVALLRFISKNLTWGLFMNSGQYAGEASDVIDFRAFATHALQADGVEVSRRMELTIFTIIEMTSSACYSIILEGNPVTLTEYKPFLYSSIRLLFRNAAAPISSPAPLVG